MWGGYQMLFDNYEDAAAFIRWIADGWPNVTGDELPGFVKMWREKQKQSEQFTAIQEVAP